MTPGRKYKLIFAAILVLALIGPGGSVYSQKQKTLTLDNQIQQTLSQITHVRNHIALLHVEWSAENKPENLAKLVKEHAPYLQPAHVDQFESIAALDRTLPHMPHEIVLARAQLHHQIQHVEALHLASIRANTRKQPVQLAQNNASQRNSFTALPHHTHPSAVTAWQTPKESRENARKQRDEAMYVSMTRKQQVKTHTAMQTQAYSLLSHHQRDTEYSRQD